MTSETVQFLLISQLFKGLSGIKEFKLAEKKILLWFGRRPEFPSHIL